MPPLTRWSPALPIRRVCWVESCGRKREYKGWDRVSGREKERERERGREREREGEREGERGIEREREGERVR